MNDNMAAFLQTSKMLSDVCKGFALKKTLSFQMLYFRLSTSKLTSKQRFEFATKNDKPSLHVVETKLREKIS